MSTKNIIPQNIYKHLTTRAKNCVEHSIAIQKKYPIKGPEKLVDAPHLVLALTKERGSIAKNILTSHGITYSYAIKYIQKASSKIDYRDAEGASSAYKNTLKKAANCAAYYNQMFIGTEHLLYGILETPHQNTLPFSKKNSQKIKTHLKKTMEAYSSVKNDDDKNIIEDIHTNKKDGSDEEYLQKGDEAEEEHIDIQTKNPKEKKSSILEMFCENLSQKASSGNIEPTIERDKEISNMIRVLSRKYKNNPLVVGDAGVGKTALVNGLADRIEKGAVPENLLNKTIYSLNLSSLLAGTMFRGEFEERMRDLVEEVSNENVILFIDEIHMMMGAGAAQGSLDAANILKPALLKGEFQCIGATTYDEFKKTVEKDGALDRRFQKLFLKEHTESQAIKTIKKLKPYYERYHGVQIPDEIVSLCVDLSVKYMPERTLPDKALDILDEAASHIKTKRKANKNETALVKLYKELEEVVKEKELTLQQEKYREALILKNKQENIEAAIDDKKRLIPKGKISAKDELNEDTVYKLVSEITSIPLNQINQRERYNLNNIENTLKRNIAGQNEAIKKVSKALIRNQAGIRDANRPMGSFLFMGPSGVGKTELAKTLASVLSAKNQEISRDNSSLIKLDMSEFSEPHTVSRMIGAPPGYVGHEESGFLTDKIRRNPYSVVLFDEIEKAHPKIFNILLQILEDGELTDTHGRTTSFKNTIIILTSNIGAEFFGKKENIGFSQKEGYDNTSNENVLTSLRDIIRPEILNRIDNVIVFKTLDKKELEKVARKQLQDMKKRLAKIAKVEFASEVPGWIVQNSKSEDRGAREIRKAIENNIEEKIAETILTGENRIIKIHIEKNSIKIS